MTFAAPHMLWLLLVLPPALALFFAWSWRKREQLRARFIQARLLPGLLTGFSPLRQKVRLGLFIAAVVCLLTALARPQWGFVWQEASQRGLDIVVAIDTSKSMLATDVAPSRLDHAKLAALDLLQTAKSDRLGLVAFAGKAFLQCPLTIDDSAFRQSVQALDVNTIPEGGTALAEAIDVALTAFKETDHYKAVVLITDGEDQDSGALEAAQQAAKAGVRLYTLGAGTPEGELIRLDNGDFVRDAQGNAVKSHLNETLLRQLAGATEGGFYLPLRGPRVIDTLYEQGLSKLPKTEHQEKIIKQYRERYHWPLALALVLLVIETLLPDSKRPGRPSPKPGTKPAPTVSAGLGCLALWLCLAAATSWASPSSALNDYNHGRYDQALQEYQKLLQKEKDDARLHFNAGDAAYRKKDFEEAVKQFNQSLSSPDLQMQQRSYYNRGNSLFQQGQKLADASKKIETWEKSVQDFDSSLKLIPQDPEAKANREYVKKLIEEVKRQQQQQQSQNNSSDQNQDKNQQNQQKQQNSARNDSQQNQQQSQNQNDSQQQKQQKQPAANDKKDSSRPQQAQQPRQDEQQKQREAAQKAEEQKERERQEQQAQAGQAKGKAPPTEQEEQAAQEALAGQMTPEQAQRMLDAEKGEEQVLQIRPEGKASDQNKPLRDW